MTLTTALLNGRAQTGGVTDDNIDPAAKPTRRTFSAEYGGFNWSSHTLMMEVLMGRLAGWMKELTGRSPMKSPGAPSHRHHHLDRTHLPPTTTTGPPRPIDPCRIRDHHDPRRTGGVTQQPVTGTCSRPIRFGPDVRVDDVSVNARHNAVVSVDQPEQRGSVGCP